jgi:predicted transcriptional regulator
MSFSLDPSERGLKKLHRDYEIAALRAVWGCNEGILSREIWEKVKKETDNPVSRSTVIKYLQEATDNGIIRYDLETCKGGHRRRYYPDMSEEDYKEYIVETVLESLLQDFPRTINNVRKIVEKKSQELLI